MRRVMLSIIFALLARGSAFATWSVIALDQKTGTLVVASATCVAQAGFASRRPPARDLMDTQSVTGEDIKPTENANPVKTANAKGLCRSSS